MPPSEKLSLEEVLKLPPMLFVVIRWKRSIGKPSGDLCAGFRIRVEERTPSEYRAIGGGKYEREPGTGELRLLTETPPCISAVEAGDTYVVTFTVPDVHLNVLDGAYKVSAELTGRWESTLWYVLAGFRRIDPSSWYLSLRPDSHIASIEFEVVRRHWFSASLS